MASSDIRVVIKILLMIKSSRSDEFDATFLARLQRKTNTNTNQVIP